MSSSSRNYLTLLASLFLAGCAYTPPGAVPPAVQRAADPLASTDTCVALARVTDAEAARQLDLVPLMLARLKERAKTDNVGVCRMSEAERNSTMLAFRNSLRSPDRAKFRAPLKEIAKSWDADDDGNMPNATQVLGAEARRKSMIGATEAHTKLAGISQSRWVALGPGNVGGRLRAILIDPRDPNRIFVGAATGGIWRSTNGGQSFSAVADFTGNLAIGSMAIDPNNPNVMYAGTGESFGGFTGVGVFKSTDGGNTWNFLQSTTTDTALNPSGSQWIYVNRIAVSRANSNIVLAATSNGIFRSTTGGQSWTQPFTIRTLDLQFDPFDANNMVAGTDNGIMYYSRDAGASWQASEALVTTRTGRGGTARAEVAYARSQQNLVYISLDNNKGDVWKSDDGGVTWTFLSNPAHTNNQGDYDNTIWVDPTDANQLVVGGLDLYRSNNGGLNFTKISTWQSAGPGLPQPHADHHVLVSAPNYSAANPLVYNGSDGGLYRSTDITRAGATGTSTWQNLNNGLAVTQFYGGAGSRAAGGAIVGGTQDNGILRQGAGTDWARIAGGDGGFSAVDPVSDDTVYGEYVYASIRRIVEGVSRTICNGITEGKKDESTITYCGPNATEQTNFISPFILDPNARDRMLVGANSLWVTDDVRTPLNPVWRAIKPPVTNPNSTRFISAVAVQKGNSNAIWVGHNASNVTGTPTQIFKTTDGTNATPTWTDVAQAGMPTSAVNRLTPDPDNPNRVWVAYSGFSSNRLWVTEDGGSNWRSISAGLPAVTIHDVKRHPILRDLLYVATANGVYASEDSGATWNATNDGPNSVRVRELFWFDNQTLVAVTFGRGMFKIDVLPPSAPGVLQFTSASQRVAEGANALVVVERLGGKFGSVSANYATGGGTATAGVDYTVTSGTLTWADGDNANKTITIKTTTDTLNEVAETFNVTLSAPVGATLGTPTVHTVTIADPDIFPQNCTMPAGFTKPASAETGWFVATDSAFEGVCSLKSSPTADAAKSQLQFTGNFVAGNVTFARRVSSEATFDCLRFLIDGVQQPYSNNCKGATDLLGDSGEVPWGLVSVPITAGMHTITWSFEKDANTIGGADAAWIDAVSLPLVATAPLDYSDMWWAGQVENGWGMSIQQHANGVQFNAIYIYDAAGLPRWYVMPGGSWNASNTTFSGAIYQPTSAPFTNYTPSRFVVGAPVGTVSIAFSSIGTATLTYTINGVSGSKSIERQNFRGGTAPFKVSDLWWLGPAEDGWGINLAQQAGTLFGVWYTYGADGKNTWFVLPDGAWTGNTYAGALYATTGSPWLGVPYNAALLKVTPVGTMSINFSNDAKAATLNYNFTAGPFAGTNQTKNIVRQNY